MSACLLINHARPEKTWRALDALQGCDPLFLFCDGPKNNPDKTAQVKALLLETGKARQKAGLQTAMMLLEENLGCCNGPLAAIKWFFENNPEGHVIEDDILVHPAFFPIHQRALETHRTGPFLWIAEGHPLPNCPTALLETQMCRLVAWSAWSKPTLQIIEKSQKTTSPWKTHGWKLLAGLHPKTQIFLWKEFNKLEKQPNWSWHYKLLQIQLELQRTGLTPTARLHENLGLDGSGHNCQNVFGAHENWDENEIQGLLAKTAQPAKIKTWERKMETQRYGRIRQSIGRKLLKLTPTPWKSLWKPVGAVGAAGSN